MKFMDVSTPFKSNGWYKIKVKDSTKRTLSNGKVIASWSSMLRQAAKIR